MGDTHAGCACGRHSQTVSHEEPIDEMEMDGEVREAEGERFEER